MAGRARRNLYKRPRPAARKKGVLCDCAPIRMPNASLTEVKTAIFAACSEGGFTVGRAVGYDQLKDTYHLIGKSKVTGKVQDVTLEGYVVADLIRVARALFGGRFEAAACERLELQRRYAI